MVRSWQWISVSRDDHVWRGGCCQVDEVGLEVVVGVATGAEVFDGPSSTF